MDEESPDSCGIGSWVEFLRLPVRAGIPAEELLLMPPPAAPDQNVIGLCDEIGSIPNQISVNSEDTFESLFHLSGGVICGAEFPGGKSDELLDCGAIGQGRFADSIVNRGLPLNQGRAGPRTSQLSFPKFDVFCNNSKGERTRRHRPFCKRGQRFECYVNSFLLLLTNHPYRSMAGPRLTLIPREYCNLRGVSSCLDLTGVPR